MFDQNIIYNPYFIVAVILEIIFKAVGLWKTGRNNQPGWFIAIFVLNTAGILPLVYLLFFQRNKNKASTFY
jgi:methionyl-tRNA synthetase